MDEMLTRIFKCIGVKRGAQKELAEYLGIHPNVITNWKNGSNKSYRGYVNEIANYFHVTVDYLLTGEQKEKPSVNDDEELEKLLEMYRTRPECRMLFSLAEGATVEDVKKAAAIIEALRKVDGR